MKVFSSVALFLSTGTALFGFTTAAAAASSSSSEEAVVGASNSLRSGAASAVQRDLQNGGESDDCLSIVDAICDMENSKYMCNIMTNTTTLKEYADFYDQLTEKEEVFTIFVPTDKAWDLDENGFKGLNNAEMRRIFEFHFYKNVSLSYDELECQERLDSMTEQGDTSRTICEKPEGTAPDADQVKHQNGNGNSESGHDRPEILTKGVSACNAELHGIDRVMLPVFLNELISNAPSESPTKCRLPSWKDWKKQAPSCSNDKNCVVAECSFPMIWMTYADCLEAETPTLPIGAPKLPSVKMGTCNACNVNTDKTSPLGAFYCYDPLLIYDVKGPKANLCLDPSCHNKKGSLTYIWDKWYCAKHNPCRNNDDDDDDDFP